MPLGELVREPPVDAAERVLVAVDCASEHRIGDPRRSHAPRSPSTSTTTTTTRASATSTSSSPTRRRRARFCATSLPSSTSTLTPELAEPLYIALVTDTGRFQYSNTTPKSLRLAAELVEAGADIHGIFQQVYETGRVREAQAARPRARARRGARGRTDRRVASPSHRLRRGRRFGAVLRRASIDYLREVEGAELAVFVREQMGRGAHGHKGSLRSSIDELDVSAIARRFGGGGHRQAAGFSSDDTLAEIVEIVRLGFLEQRAATRA